MAVKFNHLIVHARDSQASARFLAQILGLAEPTRVGPFFAVETEDGVSFDFIGDDGRIATQHYAFQCDEAEFDEIFGRIRQLDLPYWADPARKRPGETYVHNGGRGVYFEDPNGHFLEVLTAP